MLREGAENGVVSGVGDVFVMNMHFPGLGDYETDNHVVEYELDRRIGWEPAPRDPAPAAAAQIPIGTRLGHRWIFDLVPDGPDATIVTESYDCSRAPERTRVAMNDGRDRYAEHHCDGSTGCHARQRCSWPSGHSGLASTDTAACLFRALRESW